jgi:hypothetical protein
MIEMTFVYLAEIVVMSPAAVFLIAAWSLRKCLLL